MVKASDVIIIPILDTLPTTISLVLLGVLYYHSCRIEGNHVFEATGVVPDVSHGLVSSLIFIHVFGARGENCSAASRNLSIRVSICIICNHFYRGKSTRLKINMDMFP